MKFTTLVSLLVASSAALALPYEKRGLSALDIACAAAIKKEISGCITSEKVTLTNLESVCELYKSDKCQDFFESNSLATKLSCDSGVKDALETFKKAIKLHAASVIDLKCAKDEKGNVCPISNYVIENGDIPSDSSDQKWQDAVNETGKSKACSESFNNYADTVKNNADGASVVNDVIGGDLTPSANTDVIDNAVDTIKKTQGGDSASGDNGADGATGTTGTDGANTTGTDGANGATDGANTSNTPNTTNNANNANNANGSGQNTANQANDSNNSTSDATTVKASLALAVVLALSTLL